MSKVPSNGAATRGKSARTKSARLTVSRHTIRDLEVSKGADRVKGGASGRGCFDGGGLGEKN